MVGITEAGAALASIKSAMEMLKGIRSFKSETEINQAVIDVQRVLLEAQASAIEDKQRQSDLIGRVNELEARLADVSKWAAEQARYHLTEFSVGRFAYVLKEEASNGEPSHKLCAKCFSDSRKSILQTVKKHSGGESVYCQHCKQKTILQEFAPPEVHTTGRRPWINWDNY